MIRLSWGSAKSGRIRMLSVDSELTLSSCTPRQQNKSQPAAYNVQERLDAGNANNGRIVPQQANNVRNKAIQTNIVIHQLGCSLEKTKQLDLSLYTRQASQAA